MIKIESNGSKWRGEEPDGLETLKQRLRDHALDPTFEKYGNFRVSLHLVPGGVHFWGNFFEISAVFSVVTDEKDTIDELTTLIRANQQTVAYKEARDNPRPLGATKRRVTVEG